MKKSSYLILAILLIATSYIIVRAINSKPQQEDNTDTEKSIKFSEDLLVEEITYNEENQILKYTMINNTQMTLEYGAVFTVMKLDENNALIETDLTDDLAFDMMLRIVEAGETFSDEVRFSLFTEPIDEGTYYIVREYKDTDGKEHIPEISFKKDDDGVHPNN